MNVRNFVANRPLIRLALLDLLPIVRIMPFLMVCCHSGLANTTIFSISFSWKIELPIDRLPCLGLVSSREGHFERLTAPFTSLNLTLCFAYLPHRAMFKSGGQYYYYFLQTRPVKRSTGVSLILVHIAQDC